MKIIAIVLLLFSGFCGFSQQSYDFSTPLPPDGQILKILPESYFGTYKAENDETFYEINQDGISLVSTIFNSISRETIRESSKYTVRNDHIFGVVEGDSLPCILEGERYYFGMRSKQQLIGSGVQNVLTKADGSTFIINFYENGGFIPTLLTFSGKKLTLQQFDYETGTTLFQSVKSQKSVVKDNMEYISLQPTGKEWSKTLKEKVFDGSSLNYIKTVSDK